MHRARKIRDLVAERLSPSLFATSTSGMPEIACSLYGVRRLLGNLASAREINVEISCRAVLSSGVGWRDVRNSLVRSFIGSSKLSRVARRLLRRCKRLWLTTMLVIQVLKRASSRNVCNFWKARPLRDDPEHQTERGVEG